MSNPDLTTKLRPYFQAITRAVNMIESITDENPMVPFDVDEDDADALRWLEDNIFV